MIGGPRTRPSAAVRVIVAGLTVITVSACGGTRSSALPTAPASSVPVASSPPDRASSPLCPLSGNVLELPRRSLTGVTLAPENAVLDGVVFTLGGPPAPGARLEVSVAAPPFSRGGQALDVEGDRVLELRFTGVETHDPSGAAAFQGPRDLEPDRRRSAASPCSTRWTVSWPGISGSPGRAA